MLVIRIELMSARTGMTQEIGRTYIVNDGNASSVDPSRGDYLVAVCRRGDPRMPRELVEASPSAELLEPDRYPRATRTGEVHDYPRLSYNVWRLVIRALRSCFPEER